MTELGEDPGTQNWHLHPIATRFCSGRGEGMRGMRGNEREIRLARHI